MSFSFFISKKYTLSKRDSKFINLISSIAIAGVALGVATLIIALSILNGFEKTLTEKIIDFDSHIQVKSYLTEIPSYKRIKPDFSKYNLPEGTVVNPYLENLAIISSKKIQEGVSIKGIYPDNSSISVNRNIVSGAFILTDSNSIVIGRKLANKLYVQTGDRITLFALANNQIPSAENLPSIIKFKITGIFES